MSKVAIRFIRASALSNHIPNFVVAWDLPRIAGPTGMLIPPINFALVVSGLYRSGHPIGLNFPFLESLHLNTIIDIGSHSDVDSHEYIEWARARGINVFQFVVPSVKEPFVLNDPEVVQKCLEIVLDKRNYPILLHSNKGKHRVGVLVGVIRKVIQRWALTAVYDEYIRFAKGKADADFSFIEHYEPDLMLELGKLPEWAANGVRSVP